MLYIRAKVPESRAWERNRPAPGAIIRAIRANLRRFGYLVVMLTVMGLISHGTQDLYPTFLEHERGLSPGMVAGIAVIYNLDKVSNLQLSADTLAGIFSGTIKNWNDPKIAKDNSGVKLPSTPIKTYHRADGSGTTSVFTAYLDATAKGSWSLGTGKTVNWPSGQAANGSSGVVAGVKQTPGSITYAEVSYAKQNSLPTAKIKNASGSYVDLSASSVSQSIDSGFSVTGSGNDLAGKLDFTKMTGYPISTVSYVIACSSYKDSKKGAVVKDFLAYAVGEGQGQADALGFAPLPASLVTKAQSAITAIK